MNDNYEQKVHDLKKHVMEISGDFPRAMTLLSIVMVDLALDEEIERQEFFYCLDKTWYLMNDYRYGNGECP